MNNKDIFSIHKGIIGFFVVLFLFVTCYDSDSIYDENKILGIWTSSGVSFENAIMSTVATKFNEDNTYMLGDYIEDEFHKSELIGEHTILQYYVFSDINILVTVQTNSENEDWIIRDTMFYDFKSDLNLLIEWKNPQDNNIDTTYYYKQK